MDIETSNAIKLFFPNPSLVQVFHEALANSLDAEASEVTIRVEIQSFSAPDTLRVTVTDNGTGFTDQSFERFSRLLKPQDSFHKGLGRLVFLNYFRRVEIESVWGNYRRTFLFSESFKGECDLMQLGETRPNRTTLKFSNFNGDRIKSYNYLKPGALKANIIERFLPTFHEFNRKHRQFKIDIELDTSKDNEQKEFLSSNESISANDLPELTTLKIEDETLDVFDDIEMAYQIRSGTGKSSQHLVDVNIDGRTIPINLIQPNSIPVDHSVIFLFSSKLFNAKSDTARQRLLLPETISEVDLYKVLRRETGKILEKQIPQIGIRNETTTKQFEEKFPHLLGYFESATVGLIDRDDSLNMAQQRFFQNQKRVLQCEKLDESTYETSLELSSRALTEYVLYREKIISRMEGMTNNNSEAEIHNLIVPRYEEFTSDGLAKDVYRNNAWLLDDKFMSFQTILSEGQMDTVIEAITLKDSPIKDDGRPDITMIFSADPKDAEAVDVVVVELKKITDGEKDNQFVINQLLSRARKLAAYCPNVEHIWYYAVIQINDELVEVLEQQNFIPMFSQGRVLYREFPTKGPSGVIVPTPTFVISYDAIVADAKSRNHTFLEILRDGMRQHSSNAGHKR